MAGLYEDRDRRILPRWRTSRKTKARDELASLHPRQGQPAAADHVRRAAVEFDRAPTISAAAEVIGGAIVGGCAEVATSAAEFVLNQAPEASEATIDLARSILRITPEVAASEESPRSVIARLRKGLRATPRNPLGWMDLAHTYTSIGENEKANAAVRCALALAPDNRFVVRSAARFYLHRRCDGDLEYAHQLVLSSAATPYDPWLMAAETSIATLRHRDPEFYRDSKEVLGAGKYGAGHLSELAGALATLELTSGGSARRVRKLFTLALEEPTDNTIAQARWASGIDPAIRLKAEHYSDPLSAEARAWHFFYNGNWKAALANFWTWHYDQPFSRKPCATGAFVAGGILGDYAEMIELSEAGLRANPGHPGLLNNLAFGMISSGEMSKAAEILLRVRGRPVSADHRIALFATHGMFAFRCGDAKLGRAYYEAAIRAAREAESEQQAVLAELHLAHEAFRAGDPQGDQQVKAAHVAVEKLGTPYIAAVEVRLSSMVQQNLIEYGRQTGAVAVPGVWPRTEHLTFGRQGLLGSGPGTTTDEV